MIVDLCKDNEKYYIFVFRYNRGYKHAVDIDNNNLRYGYSGCWNSRDAYSP